MKRSFHQKAPFTLLAPSASAFLPCAILTLSLKAGPQNSTSSSHSSHCLTQSIEFSLLGRACWPFPKTCLPPVPWQSHTLRGYRLHSSPPAPPLSTFIGPSLSTLFSHTHFIGMLLWSEAHSTSMDCVSPQPKSKVFRDKNYIFHIMQVLTVQTLSLGNRDSSVSGTS